MIEVTGQVEDRLQVFLQQLPKTDQHFHFEGAIPWSCVKALHPYGDELPQQSPMDSINIFPTFNDFLQIFLDYWQKLC